ncbi:pyrimidine/purine nucleoside phosphorylase [Natronoflexus pectinivorans]|uniref:Pyrimidine/purine nucleoside phosphorylase n=1 Tax=Natronoflexus pectinivorans TaxID=682526 RepID=A0A4R2GDX0_9BACT|nr:pyrimidine/purine nucleoside phosphorylase [Natronoflexus pectinivorans]TCO06031.1 hypothetical protein EV194_1149 [Natronoflexus pectinivorans]
MYKVNEYFDGKVASISHNSADGKATVGVMAAGEYEFGTSSVEIMTIIAGEMKIKLSGETEWTTYKKFDSFRVEKDTSFQVSVTHDTPYLCLYL